MHEHAVGPLSTGPATVTTTQRKGGLITALLPADMAPVRYELGRFDEAIALAGEIREADMEAQPRSGAVQRALALLDTGTLDDATVAVVRRTPPADEGDLRHILGVALVC